MSFLKNFLDSQQSDIHPTWKELTSTDQLDEAVALSAKQPVFLFKHSTRCGISQMAKSNLEASPIDSEKGQFFYLDLLNHRDVSGEIASRFGIAHQSPQLILLKNGKAVKDISHHAITENLLQEWMEQPID